jgi:uncharacterized protein YcfL
MRNLIKKLWFIPLIFLFYSCSTAPAPVVEKTPKSSQDSDKQESGVKAPVWVTINVDEYFVSQETVKYEDGFVDGYRLYEYDESGKILKKAQIGSDETVNLKNCSAITAISSL